MLALAQDIAKKLPKSYNFESGENGWPANQSIWNLFIFDMGMEAGIPMPVGANGMPLTAWHWADRFESIPGWAGVDPKEKQPGDVIASGLP
jgi:hypothetical protein